MRGRRRVLRPARLHHILSVAEPNDQMGLLAEYHKTLGEIIAAYGATLTCYTGDGLMLLLNAPLPRCSQRAWRSKCRTRFRSRSYRVHPPGPLSGQQGDRTVTLLAPTAALLNPG